MSINVPTIFDYSFRGDASFNVFFEVTEERVYEFQGDYSWSGSLPEFGNGFTTVVFRDDTNNASIYFAEADDLNAGGAFQIFPTLSPGIIYQLKVRAHLSGDSNAAGSYVANANFSFDLFPVIPEPSTATLCVLCIFPAVAGRSLSGRRNSR